MKINVAIVEDDKNYNDTLKKIIDFHDDMVCVAQFFCGKTALNELIECKPDVVLMDIQLQDLSGIDIVAQLSKANTNIEFIMCTTFEDDEIIFSALRAGASGYLVKGEPMNRIIQAILEANLGGAPMSYAIAKRVLLYFQTTKPESEDVASVLTVTEKKIIELLSQGFIYKEIALQHFVSIETVKKHIRNIYKKLQVNNKIEAINKLNQKI